MDEMQGEGIEPGREPMADEGDFVVIERVPSPHEAHIIRNCLESAGIAAHVADANTVQANWLWTVALGGVRVLVRASAAAQAREVISQYRSGALSLGDEAVRLSHEDDEGNHVQHQSL